MESRGLAAEIKVLAEQADINQRTLTGNLAGGKPLTLNTALKIIRALRKDAEVVEHGEIEILEELNTHQQSKRNST